MFMGRKPVWVVQHPCNMQVWIVDTAMKARIARRNGCFTVKVDHVLKYDTKNEGKKVIKL